MNARILACGLGLAAAASLSIAMAQPTAKTIVLNGLNEIPSNTSAGTGKAEISYDPDTKLLSWKITYTGLTGPATAGHIHGPAERGRNAPVVIPFEKVESPIEGSATLTDAQAADFVAGKYYINIHTAENKGGEIRAQIPPR